MENNYLGAKIFHQFPQFSTAASLLFYKTGSTLAHDDATAVMFIIDKTFIFAQCYIINNDILHILDIDMYCLKVKVQYARVIAAEVMHVDMRQFVFASYLNCYSV